MCFWGTIDKLRKNVPNDDFTGKRNVFSVYSQLIFGIILFSGFHLFRILELV